MKDMYERRKVMDGGRLGTEEGYVRKEVVIEGRVGR